MWHFGTCFNFFLFRALSCHFRMILLIRHHICEWNIILGMSWLPLGSSPQHLHSHFFHVCEPTFYYVCIWARWRMELTSQNSFPLSGQWDF